MLLALIGVCVCVQVSECVKSRFNVERAFVAGISPESRFFVYLLAAVHLHRNSLQLSEPLMKSFLYISIY